MELNLRSISACDFQKHMHTHSTVDADVIVPDSKPDIFRVLAVKAYADMSERYMRNDKIIYSGNVRFNIIYVGEIDKRHIHSIEYVAPFNYQAEAPGIDEQCMGMTSCCVEKTDFHIKNSRKLSVGALLGFDTMVIKQHEISAVESVQGEDSVPVRYSDYEFDCVKVCKEFELQLSDGFAIPVDVGSDAEVCGVDIRMEIPEIKTVNNKAVVRGNGRFTTLCVSSGEISSYENELSFTEIFDTDGVTSDMSVSMHFEVADCSYSVDASGEEIMLDVDYKLRGYICAFEHTTARFADDMYDPDYSFEKKSTGALLMQNCGPFNFQTTLKDSASPSDPESEIKEVYFMNAVCEYGDSNVNGSKVFCNLTVHSDYIYIDSSDCLANIRRSFPVKLEIPIDSDIDGDVCTNVIITNFGYTLSSATEIQSRIVLKAQVTVSDAKRVELITDFSSDLNSPIDKTNQPSIVVCYPSCSETLWSIARKHNTTSLAIAQINGLDADAPAPAGKPVIIPKRKLPDA